VSWLAPADNGGLAITGYTVTAYLGASVAGSVATGSTSASVSGLTNGANYTFTVLATNALGTSAPSTSSNSVTPATVPDAPTGVVAPAGNGSATVAWNAPADNGGLPISGYVVTPYIGLVAQPSSTFSTTAATVTGLTNGTTYTFVVEAVNGVGAGSGSPASNPVTPATVPGVATQVFAVGGNGSATVTWNAPASTGGSPITGYTVTSSPGGLTCSTTATSCVVTGLTNGVPYTFDVVATNAVGSEPASAPSNSVTPATTPDPPATPVATSGNGSATVSWLAPGNDGGSPVTGYVVTAVDLTTPLNGGQTVSVPASPASVSGLVNGDSYVFVVKSVNSVGTGPESVPSNTVTPAFVAGPPTNLTATPDDSAVTLSWTAPASSGGSPVTGYSVSDGSGQGCTTLAVNTSCVVTGLTNGESYSFGVVAINAFGTSPVSAPAVAVPVASPVPPSPNFDSIVQVNTSAIYAGDTVTVMSPDLTTACQSLDVESLQGGTPSAPTVGVNELPVVLDSDGNATVVLRGIGCVAGTYTVESSIDSLGVHASSTVSVNPPAITFPYRFGGSSASEVETGNTPASGHSDVAVAFVLSTSPAYAGDVATITSSGLAGHCKGGIHWESNGQLLPTTKAKSAAARIDDDGNVEFVFQGASCAAGKNTVSMVVATGSSRVKYSTHFSVVAPAVSYTGPQPGMVMNVSPYPLMLIGE
jgi:hypothetical protein